MAKKIDKAAMRYLTAEDIFCAELPEGQARLARFSYRVRHGCPQQPADMQFLAASFEQIIAGADIKKALGVSGRRGRPKVTANQRDKQLQYTVAVEIHRQNGMTKSKAITEVARKFHKAFETIEDYHTRDAHVVAWHFREAKKRGTKIA